MGLVDGFAFDAAHLMPVVLIVVIGIFVIRLVKGVLKWAILVAIAAAALFYFHVI